jgi:hypothetical protein
MKALEASELTARIFKQFIEDRKHTGSFDIHGECCQGGICKVQFTLSEKNVAVFEFTRAPKGEITSEKIPG